MEGTAFAFHLYIMGRCDELGECNAVGSGWPNQAHDNRNGEFSPGLPVPLKFINHEFFRLELHLLLRARLP